MSNTNTIALSCRIAKEPQVVNFENSDMVLTTINVAHNQYDKKAQDNNIVTWFELNIWGNRGETFRKLCSVGDMVFVTGTLKIREWQGKNGTGFTNKIDVSDFENLTPKSKSKGNGSDSYDNSNGYDTSSNGRNNNNSNNEGGGNPDDVPF